MDYEPMYRDTMYLDGDDVMTENEVLNTLNRFNDENEQLKLDKQQLHRAMSRKEVRHKQFKNKVFDLINEKIKEYQKYDGYDTEKYYIGTQLLNKLKKELLE